MKKLFLTLTLAIWALSTWATSYTGTLTVIVNGQPTTQDGVSIIINANTNGTYNLALNNFVMSDIPIGNIVVNDINGTTNNNTTILYVDKSINIDNGTDENYEYWAGPELGLIPIKMISRFTDNYLVVDIDIDMLNILGEVINVHFSNLDTNFISQFQMPNSDFEEWDNSKNEPRYWHGFESATSTSSVLLSNAKKVTFAQSTDTRNNNGFCALIQSKSIMGVTANGTMTNGRLSANSATAANTWNHSEMDISSTATDNYGDKFYMSVYKRPDAINTWIKFDASNNNDKATLSAVIFNGEYYQDPEPKPGERSGLIGTGTAYTKEDSSSVASRVVAKAQNKQIPVSNNWTLLNVPFDYSNYTQNNATANAILVTMSTNATPGSGTAGDKLYIDDMELLYYANVKDIKFKGSSIEGFDPTVKTYLYGEYDGIPVISDFDVTVEGIEAITGIDIIEESDCYKALIYTTSIDLKNAHGYTIIFTKAIQTVELEGVEFTSDRKWSTWYGNENLALPENVTAYIVTNINGDVATIQPTGYLPETTGVLLYSETPASNVTALPYSGTTNTFVNNMLEGSINGTTIDKGYVLYNNYFVLTTGGSLPAHRCYIPIFEDAPAAPSILKIGNSAITAITDIEATVSGKVRYYDLNGREVNENATGILIRRNVDGTVTKIVK